MNLSLTKLQFLNCNKREKSIKIIIKKLFALIFSAITYKTLKKEEKNPDIKQKLIVDK